MHITYRPLLCSVVSCEMLQDPINGGVEVLATVFSSTAKYNCDNGYNLTGSATRLCEANGSWNPLEPFCERKCLCIL